MGIENMLKENKDFKAYARSYGQYISTLLDALDVSALAGIVREFEDAKAQQKTIFIIGNGGSAATTSHMANDLGFGVYRHAKLGFKVVSLTDNMPVVTVLANDVAMPDFYQTASAVFSAGR